MKKFIDYMSLRIKNYAFWTSLFALIPLLCEALGILTLPSDYQDIVNAFLAFLIAAGVVNNPTTTTKWFADDKKDNKKS